MLGCYLETYLSERIAIRLNLKLRNHLTEVLLDGLKGMDQADTLVILSAYCRAVRANGKTRVGLKDLAPSKDLILSNYGIFSIDMDGSESDPMVDLLPQFCQEVDYLCERITAYSRVLAAACKVSASLESLDWAVKIGVLLFNEALYFECHEFLEGFWRKEKAQTKEFLQGIISLATALYHLERSNRPSAIKLFADGRCRLQAFGSSHKGLAIEPLLEQTEKIQILVEEGSPAALEQLKRMPPPTIQFYR